MHNTLEYCQACLSNQRKLYPLSKLRAVLREINLSEFKECEGGICWECKSIITRYRRFKTQVLEAQRSLNDANKFFKSLSSFSTQTNCDYDYQYIFNADPLVSPETTKPEVKIKEENNLDSSAEDRYESDSEINSNNGNSKEIDELFENLNEQKSASVNDIYVDLLKTDLKPTEIQLKKNKQKRYKSSRRRIKEAEVDEEEIKEKFTTVVFTEEEMLKNREEKRNQPNFKKIPFKCDSCVLGFTRKDTYDLHLEKKHDEKIGDHVCPVCLTRFSTEKSVERHKKKHYVCFRCRLCRYETLELWSAVSHCRGKHSADSWQRIHCPYCEVIAKTPEELSEHIGTEHTVHCNECGGTFKGLSTLRSHKRRIHGVKREFICDLCSKSFKTKSRLESHVVTHNDALAQKLAYCALCKVQYKNIYVYRNHLKTSANHAEQAYQCRDCNKKFASKVYWKKHYNFYHLRKSEFQCELCNKLFISEWRLKNHRQTQHGLSRSRDHNCNVCGKQFFTLSTLKGHQLTHSEQRSFLCEDCGDTFKQRPALYTHCRRVHRQLRRKV